MKHMLRLLAVCLGLGLITSTSNAQTYVLEVDSVVALPDSIVDGTTVTFYMMVSQTGTPLFYQGNIYVELEYGGNFYEADTTLGQGFVTPNAPNQLQVTHRFSTDDDLSIGDNVVVVWPRIGDGSDPPQTTVPYHTIITLIEPNGVQEVENESSPFIYPNPASEIIYLENRIKDHVISLRINDQLGRTVLRSSKNGLLNVSQLSNGLYFLVVELVDGSIRSQRVVIRH